MANQTVEVLDEQLGVCPVGEVGQLYIGGVGLARGYFNRPAITAKRFIADSRAGVRDNKKLYATGDLGAPM